MSGALEAQREHNTSAAGQQTDITNKLNSVVNVAIAYLAARILDDKGYLIVR